MIDTVMWKGNLPEHLSLAAQYLQSGKLVAFPTETVYGLGANAFDPEASGKIYQAKGRPSDNPLIVHIFSIAQLEQLVREVTPTALQVMKAFWPGPLTLVMKKSEKVPDCITGGLDSVAVRMPDHPVAQALLKQANIPIAAPSANTSGKPSPTLAEHVWHDLYGKIDGIVDGGATKVGLESTVLDVTGEIPTILRPGGVTKEQLEQVLGEVNGGDMILGLDHCAPKAPGMKYKHYAPEAPVIICQGDENAIAAQLHQAIQMGEKSVGIMVSQETFNALGLVPSHVKVQILGSKNRMETIASALFASLRWFDQQGVDIIYTEQFPADHIGTALMNRLYKAAGGADQK